METLDRTGDAREAYLKKACTDFDLDRAKLDALIRAHERAGNFLESSPRPKVDDWIGKKIGAFELVRLLGSGGSGRVYEARRPDDFDQRVAVKLLRRTLDASEQLRRFHNECEALARMKHPNIASLLDAGVTDDGRPFLIMDLVEGEPIHEHCDGNRLRIEERLDLFRKVCEAVAYAHSKLIIHRDLKPGNILVGADGNPKLLDFGIAKLLSSDDPETRTAEVRLTPRYASPEQLEGKAVTTQSDVFSLGTVLYEILTGILPYSFDGETSRDRARAIRSTTVPNASSTVDKTSSLLFGESADRLRRRLRGDLDLILGKALHPDIERRYSSPLFLSKDIGRFLEGRPISARPDTVRYRLSKFVGRNRGSVTVASLMLLALILAAVISTVSLTRVTRSQKETETQKEIAERTVEFLHSMISSVDPQMSQSTEDVSVKQLLAVALPRIDEELAGQPVVAGNLLQTIAQTYLSMGSLEEGEAAQKVALERLEPVLGTDHREVGLVVSKLAHFAWKRGSFEEAKTLAEDALHRLRNAPAEDRFVPANELVAIHSKLGDSEGAIAGGVQAVALAREIGDPEGLLYALNNLGLSMANAGRGIEAKPHFEEAIELTGQLYGPRSIQSGQMNNNLGYALKSGPPEPAIPYFRTALSIYADIFEKGDMRLAVAESNLADVLTATEEYEEAEQLHLSAVSAFHKTLGKDHPNVGHATNGLAMLQMQKGDHAGCIENMREVIRIYETAFGTEHRNSAIAFLNLARCLRADGRWDEALEFNRKALKLGRALLPADPSAVGSSLHLMGELFQEAGRLEEAEDWYRQAMEVYSEINVEKVREINESLQEIRNQKD